MTLRTLNQRIQAIPAVALAFALAATVSCRGGGDAGTAQVGSQATPLAGAVVADVVEDGTQDRVAQVSLVEGNVSMLPVDADDWETVAVNEPVFEGYQVYADDDARGELLVGDGKYARFADGAALTVSRLDPNWAQFELGSGTCELALDRWSDGDYYEISAPGGALVPQRAGSYRVDVTPDGRTRVIVLRGAAEITTPDGTFVANEGDVVDLGHEQAHVNVVSGGAAGYQDAFYDWSGRRDVYYRDLNAYDVPQPVRVFEGRNDIYGIIGLAAFGIWQALDNDRYCWVPYDARRTGWTPYQNGYWDYSPVVGWTWISNESWGWAPYHYGRWDYTDRYGWAWAPYYEAQTVGVVSWREQYRWYPAQVYFYQPPQTNVYAWVPLAPGEPYLPYTSTLVVRDERAADFRPRFLRENRAVYVVTPEELELRERPRRADRALVARMERIAPEQIQVAKLPKPQRIVAQRQIARVRPNRDLIDRPVVVTDKSLQRPVKPATQRALAREQRQIQKADRKQLAVDRQPLSPQNAPKPIVRGKAGERAPVVASTGQGQAPSVAQDRQSARQQRQLERQQQRQEQAAGRAAARPQQAGRQQQRQAAPPKQRPQVDRQQQRPERQQQKAQRQPQQRPQAAARQQVGQRRQAATRQQAPQRAARQQPQRSSAQPKVTRPAGAKATTSSGKAGGKANGGGKKGRP
jgi:hypothetical protein